MLNFKKCCKYSVYFQYIERGKLAFDIMSIQLTDIDPDFGHRDSNDCSLVEHLL